MTTTTTGAEAPSNIPNDKTSKVLVSVVLDRSGSMNSNRASTISGYNEYINGLKQEKDSTYDVTLIQFDAPVNTPELTVSYENRALADVPELTLEGYVPRGNTPLYDAIGECVRRTDANGRGVIVLVITDGMENASTEFTKETVKALIKQKESEGWTFSFLGANIDSYAVGSSLGVAPGNIANYAAGHEQTMFRAAAASSNLRASGYRTKGVRAMVDVDFIDDAQRAEMESHTTSGGRPAAPPTFPKPEPKKRDWKTSNA
jgi:uncharacterized protein YegL